MRLLSTSLLLLILSCNQPGKLTSFEFSSEDTTSIKKVIEDQKNAWNNGDIDGYMKGYLQSDSTRFISKRGASFGYDSITARYKRYYDSKEKMGHLEFEHIKFYPMSKVPPMYQVTGNWAITGKDSAGGFFSLLFIRNKNDWKIVVDHTW